MKTLLIALSFLISTSVFSQNITNTLGTSGVFTIKDATNIYLTLDQSTGQVNILKSLRLEYLASSTTGVIFKGTNRFIHNYGFNTFLGIDAGNFTLTSQYNTGIGSNSLQDLTTGTYNSALGAGSIFHNTTGIDNTAVGYNSLLDNIIGFENTAVGSKSLSSNLIGNYNSALGYNTLLENTSGSRNTAVGYESLIANTLGIDNTAIGYSTGTIVTTGDNLTLIGYNAEPTSATVNNQITLGNNEITSLRCNVTTITSLSDARDKKNIKDLSLGIDFLMKIKPRLFNWDKREWYENNTSDGSKMKEAPTAGFIAQELDEVQTTENTEWLNLVLKDNPEKFEATPGNLLPVMVKAIQELRSENDKLKSEGEKLNIKNACLTARQEELKIQSEKLKSENIDLKNDAKDLKQRILKLEQAHVDLVSELKGLKEINITEVKKGDVK